MNTRIVAALLLAILPASWAGAANWLELQNSEQPEAPAYTIWGFIQPHPSTFVTKVMLSKASLRPPP